MNPPCKSSPFKLHESSVMEVKWGWGCSPHSTIHIPWQKTVKTLSLERKEKNPTKQNGKQKQTENLMVKVGREPIQGLQHLYIWVILDWPLSKAQLEYCCWVQVSQWHGKEIIGKQAKWSEAKGTTLRLKYWNLSNLAHQQIRSIWSVPEEKVEGVGK